MMSRERSTRLTFNAIGVISALAVALSFTACGGGGGGGGSSAAFSSGAGVALVSITFPESTDLSNATTVPPLNAPLSQQVVFTFSGPVTGPVTSSGIQIAANLGLDYTGPEVAVDKTKNLIFAKGSFEVSGNVVVFTPYIPVEKIDLSPGALLKDVPGLLPEFTYSVFVPLGSTGSIPNLKGIDKSVANPVEFTTLAKGLESLYFQNHPAVPPKVVSVDPADGTVDFEINTFNQGNYHDIMLGFDQPLDFAFGNIEGEDHNGDGVRDQNVFLGYTDPRVYTAVDRSITQLGFIARLDVNNQDIELIGFTNFDFTNVGLKSIVFIDDPAKPFINPYKMVGCVGNKLYDVDYENPSSSPPICELANERTLSQGKDVRGLLYTRQRELLGIEVQENSLLRITPDTGEVEVLGALASGLGNFQELALGMDNKLYGLRVFNPGSPDAVSAIERINPDTLICETVIPGMSGDYSSLGFLSTDILVVFNATSHQWVHLDLETGFVLHTSGYINDPLITSGSRLDFSLKYYELGCTLKVLDNSYHGATVNLSPSGVLPFGKWVDIMVRNSLANLTGGSLVANEGYDPLGADTVARFKTKDLGNSTIKDEFLEDFLDNTWEEINHEFTNARALWNVQDPDNNFPDYEHLLAGFGMTGGGELGDLEPNAQVTTAVILDTNYQPLPLLDGSTPDVIEPTVVLNGEFHFHDINIPAGVTLMARGANPLVLTATGSVTIAGTIDVSGLDGGRDVTFNSAYIPTPGGQGGPGGGKGGRGQPPIPEDFSSLTVLQSVPRGERGWGPKNLHQIGGQGGESSAQGPDVPWQGSGQDNKSRGAGGGGGTYVQEGFHGYSGKGKFGVDDKGEFYEREHWDYWDGSYAYDPNWKPEHGLEDAEKINEWSTANGKVHQHSYPGDPGELVFKDKLPGGELNTENDYIGENGELETLQGGQGGGGGGSRLDSMNPATNNQAQQQIPQLAPSAYDSKGGGGGGGGGAIAIHSLGSITIGRNGQILARGGTGGGGEVIAMSTFGGGGGGGSGGAIILNSASKIVIDKVGSDFGHLDVSGGWGADSKYTVNVVYSEVENPCELNTNGTLKNTLFCSWTRSEGGYGGYGLIQLMVPDPSNPQMLDYSQESVEARLIKIGFEPNYPKYNNDKASLYVYSVDPQTKEQIWPKSADCLVPPERTLSTINPMTFAISKWIDMGRLVERQEIGGNKAPSFFPFEGTKVESGWAVVNTSASGDVINSHIMGLNDIEVDAPDQGKKNFIEPSTEVAIQFQGTEAVVPGSKVPSEDPSVLTGWTPFIESLNGKQFIRFKVKLDVAKDGNVSLDNYKPQVNFVRLRMEY